MSPEKKKPRRRHAQYGRRQDEYSERTASRAGQFVARFRRVAEDWSQSSSRYWCFLKAKYDRERA